MDRMLLVSLLLSPFVAILSGAAVHAQLGNAQIASGVINAAPEMAGLCGNQNSDVQVDIFDVIIDIQIIVGLSEPTEEQQRLSDVVRDGTIDIFDVMLTLQHIVGLTEITECGPPD